jgi:RsiW-degrading membrane proteinase PrsW (M82 family)
MREQLNAPDQAGRLPKAPLTLSLVALLVLSAGAGGWVAAGIAVVPGLGAGGTELWLLLLLAPFYEEALKPIGVYFVFLRWPQVTLGPLRTAVLCALGGLVFAVVESWLFIDGRPESGRDYEIFRYTAPVAMHVLASFILGLGLTPAILSWLGRRGSLPKRTREAYFTAAGLHMFYNLVVLILAAGGLIEFAGESDAR